MTECLRDAGPIVVWLHGPAGAGKSGLLESFKQHAEARGATLVSIDCRTVEPTPSGVLGAMGELTGVALTDLEQAASALSVTGARVVIAFDNYEVFRLADSWLRRKFIPALSEDARVVFVSREPPTAGWISATEWRDYFSDVSLDVSPEQSPEEATRRCLDGISEPEVRHALDAVSVVRRINRPMLAALCPSTDTGELFDTVASLPFVESRRDGLAIQDAVRRVIGHRLQSGDPERYRHYQKEAWKVLHRQLKESPRADLWRCTADIIYLIENPVIREAFFPSQSAPYGVEPAMPGDRDDVLAIVERHETPAAAQALELWWKHLLTAFHVVKDKSGAAVGFYCVAKPDEVGSDWMRLDPVARNWQRHWLGKGASDAVPSLFLRRWLSRDDGEAPCAAQAAAWVDIKRTYLELRPELRRVYLTLQDIGPYGPAATELGFTVLGDLAAAMDDSTYHTAMLDFGPGSVDGWICNLVAAELGVAEDQLLDAATRELVLNGSRIALTPLEFGVVSLLESRAGEAISRDVLLKHVWGHSYDGGSNVVDAVIRGLRRKCGEDSSMFETVRGVGYRLRA